MTETRTCKTCRSEKPLDEYRFIPQSNHRRLACRDCERAYQREMTKAYKKRKALEKLALVSAPLIAGPDIWETVRDLQRRLQKVEAALTKTTETCGDTDQWSIRLNQ